MLITPIGRTLALLFLAGLVRENAVSTGSTSLDRGAQAATRAWSPSGGEGELNREIVTVAADELGPISPNAYRRSLYRICRVTAYHDRGLTAAGVPSGVGQCAAPEDIPFGSIIRVPALNRWFVVTDRTHKRFRRNTVDLFMPDRAECLQFGVNYMECEILVPHFIPRYGSLQLQAAVATIRSISG